MKSKNQYLCRDDSGKGIITEKETNTVELSGFGNSLVGIYLNLRAEDKIQEEIINKDRIYLVLKSGQNFILPMDAKIRKALSIQ